MPLSLRDLLCSEDAGELAETSRKDDGAGAGSGSGSGSAGTCPAEFWDDSDELVAGFIGDEADRSAGLDYRDQFRSNSLDPASRGEVVDWILKVRAYYCFRPSTAYLAVNYMDSFLASHHLPQNEWALQLLSVACLSIAAKLEETLVPSLLELQVKGPKFIFEPRTILRMELLVLTALNWRLQFVTPFTFINFFARKVDPLGKYAKDLVSQATEITLATTKDVQFLSHPPSSLAAAAIICAADEVKDLAFVSPAVAASWCIRLIEEGIANCYQSMRQFIADNMQKKPPVLLPKLRTPAETGAGISSSSPSNKRRKLNDKECLYGP